MSGWLTIHCTDNTVHVVPDEDLRPHQQFECWCCPAPAVDEESVIVHNSMDRRERHENGAPLH